MKEDKYFYPITSPEKNETTESILDRWDKFDLLPPLIQDKISSKDSAEKIKLIGDIFRLTPVQTGRISIAICKYYFGELHTEDFSIYLAKEIPVDMAKAQEITRAVFQRIINDASQEKENQAQIEKLTLSAALQKYPEVGEQLVTSNRILLNRFPEPARPSIKNWIADYTFTMGFDPHDSAARGIYLFQNKNTRNLNRQDQSNLSHLLKAFDTGETIKINSTLKQVIFPRFTIEKRSAPETRHSAPPIDLSPEKKPAFSSNTSFQKERALFQKTHSVGISTEKKSLVTNPIIKNFSAKPALSGTFTLPRKNLAVPTTTEEKRLPAGPNIAALPIAENNLPKKPTLQFTSPQRLPFEKQTAAPTGRSPMEKIKRPDPEPLKIIPRNFKRDPLERKLSLPKNVVNLKEE